jgi:methanethiol S-methyltransferase
MNRTIAFVYGVVVYLIGLVTTLYTAGFVGNLVVPKTIDSGEPGQFGQALLIDALLLGLFGIQHSLMARPGFKKWWTRLVPQPVERSTYVLFTSLALILIFWGWQPITGVVWRVENPIGRSILWSLYFIGWAIVFLTTFLINHFDLFGLRQVYLFLKEQKYTYPGFVTPLFYKLVRHPLMLGFLIAFWATPHMTVGHLVFSVVMTAYILYAIQLEERDMVSALGKTYEEYREQVPMVLPVPKKK